MGELFAGRYELVDPIGRGGTGMIWRSWDRRRRRYVAVKVLQQRDAHALLRFVREQALRIDHPHVLAPASWAADDDKVLFTMDLVRGGSLSHLIGDYGPLPPAFVCALLEQLLAGLAAVHAEGVVHRDIKPANVLLEATGTGRPHLRLSDFGIAMRKGEPRLTEPDYVVGTPGYFAPEQLVGAEPDFPADLFAVGLVALYLLTGRKPDAEALVERYLEHGMPTAPAEVPDALWEVVGTLLQPDPEARFRTATGARKALRSAVELLPDPDPDEEPVEIFDQIGPLPEGFGPDGPLISDAPRHAAPWPDPHETGSFRLAPPTPPRPSAPPPPYGPYAPQRPHSATLQGAPPPPAAPPGRPPYGYGAGAAGHGTPAPLATPPIPAHAPTPTPPPAPLPGTGSGVQAPAPGSTGSASPAHPATAASAAPATPPDPPAASAASTETHLPSPSPAPGSTPDGPDSPSPAGPAGPATAATAAPGAPEAAASPAEAPAAARRRAAARKRRPGPPPRVALPVLLLALCCFVYGCWALGAA
jgi:serine/threonine protein kinase